MKPFFTYYGGKWRSAPRYPKPECNRLVEPFAGSAGYSVRHPHLDVELFDTNPAVAGVWEYLIAVSPEEIRRLPVMVNHVNELRVPQEAKWLIGFWLNKGTAGMPRHQPSKWMRSEKCSSGNFWGEIVRERIASQVDGIRHWKVFCADYQEATPGRSTWFVDPPYLHQTGCYYPQQIDDYMKLAQWCKGLDGQVIVCEREGADWLPFRPHLTAKTMEGPRGKSRLNEVIWTSGAVTPTEM